MMEAIRSSETSVPTKAMRRQIPEDGILRSHRRENLKSYIQMLVPFLDGCNVWMCQMVPSFPRYMLSPSPRSKRAVDVTETRPVNWGPLKIVAEGTSETSTLLLTNTRCNHPRSELTAKLIVMKSHTQQWICQLFSSARDLLHGARRSIATFTKCLKCIWSPVTFQWYRPISCSQSHEMSSPKYQLKSRTYSHGPSTVTLEKSVDGGIQVYRNALFHVKAYSVGSSKQG
jgi:hypothetical protein